MAELQLCLDFINTEGVERNSPPDRLEDIELFLEWAADQRLIDPAAIEDLRETTGSGAAATRFLRTARELREALYRILAALIDDREPSAGDRAILDRHLAEALPGVRLERRSGHFQWVIAEPPKRLGDLLWPIALSAADLLRSDRLDRLKECGGETCSWMFIDESRNRSRRWCDMSDCGNRAKARRFYRRHSQTG